MEPNVEKLKKAIEDMQLAGVSFNQMQQKAKVHNLSRIVSGDMAATPQLWKKLKEAYPLNIPDIEYLDGGEIYKPTMVSNTIKGANISNNRQANNIYGASEDAGLSQEHRLVIDKIKALPKDEVEALLAILLVKKTFKDLL